MNGRAINLECKLSTTCSHTCQTKKYMYRDLQSQSYLFLIQKNKNVLYRKAHNSNLLSLNGVILTAEVGIDIELYIADIQYPILSFDIGYQID
jgi:hypothetical protein